MTIDRHQILAIIRRRGYADQAPRAARELPDQVDPAEHAALLSQFGLGVATISRPFRM